mgnify:FL=1
MYDNIERELKLLINKQVYDNIMNSYDFHKSIIQTNTYFDTANQDVKKQHGAVRIRTIENKKIFTLKIKKDEYTHYEFEKEISTENINEIEDPEILNWFNQCRIPKNLHPTANFTTLRNVYEFENGELCLDKTTFKNHIDYEIEYEYTSDHDGIQFFNSILDQYGLKWQKIAPAKLPGQ